MDRLLYKRCTSVVKWLAFLVFLRLRRAPTRPASLPTAIAEMRRQGSALIVEITTYRPSELQLLYDEKTKQICSLNKAPTFQKGKKIGSTADSQIVNCAHLHIFLHID